ARTISLRRLNLKHVPGDNNFFGGPVDKRKQIFDPMNVFFRNVKNNYIPISAQKNRCSTILNTTK
ncbi:hypothetical protein, partial [Escherichia coli]|uniref:hypothetical protein n=1 Tax=Escherichia coli TaxID=562 RepID=UPI001BAF2BD7